jgi:hypothetical protein
MCPTTPTPTPAERAPTPTPRLRIRRVTDLKNSKRFVFLSFFSYLAIFVSIFPDVVFFGTTFAKRDILRFYYPVWDFAVQTIKSGTLPLWNPYSSYGTPFLANIQTCVFYPLSAILYLPNYLWAFNFYILLHLTLAGLFCCVWMRECGASKEASFLSGMSYCLGGYVMSAISLTISLAALVYFPLALLTLRRSLKTDTFFWKAMGALVLLVQYLAGDPAVFFSTLVVLTLFVLYKTAVESFLRRKLYLKYAFDLFKIIAIFLGLSAFHTLLFFELLMHSNRALMGYDQVTTWSLQYNDLISIAFPYFSDISLVFMKYWERQSWMENAYAGVTVLLLACIALKGIRKNDLIGYHVVLALFGVALSLGCFCSVYDIFYYGFPFFKFIRYPVRFLFMFSFAVACLAGFGLDQIFLRSERKDTLVLSAAKARVVALFMLIVLALVIVSMVYSHGIASSATACIRKFFVRWANWDLGPTAAMDIVVPVLVNLNRMALFICLFLLGILAAWHLKARKALIVSFFMLIVFADLVDVNVVEIRLNGEMLKKPGQNLARVLQDPDIFRVLASPESVKLQYDPPGEATLMMTLSDLKETMTPNFMLPHRVADVSGYDSIYLQKSMDINDQRRNIKDPTQHWFYDMLNIKYMVSPREEIGAGYQLIQKSRPANLFINERALPRAYLVPEAKSIMDEKEILKTITRMDYDPKKTIYLDETPPVLQQATDDVKPEVKIDEYTPNRVRMKVSSDRAQWLFFSDMHYPGWKAFLNGDRVKIFRANYTFRAIPVPAGTSIVEWKYDPILFRIGGGVSLLTAIGLVTSLIRRRRSREL